MMTSTIRHTSLKPAAVALRKISLEISHARVSSDVTYSPTCASLAHAEEELLGTYYFVCEVIRERNEHIRVWGEDAHHARAVFLKRAEEFHHELVHRGEIEF